MVLTLGWCESHTPVLMACEYLCTNESAVSRTYDCMKNVLLLFVVSQVNLLLYSMLYISWVIHKREQSGSSFCFDNG